MKCWLTKAVKVWVAKGERVSRQQAAYQRGRDYATETLSEYPLTGRGQLMAEVSAYECGNAFDRGVRDVLNSIGDE